MDTLENLIKEKITSIPDFPKKGIIFRDVTTLIEDREAFGAVISAISWHYRKSGTVFDKVAGPEARGFIVGAPVAYALNAGLVLVRKPSKLPARFTPSHMISSTAQLRLRSTATPSSQASMCSSRTISSRPAARQRLP